MLKRIAITNYKSFRRLDLQLGPLAVLMGPNAAGKSNFLDAIKLVSRLATGHDLNEAFEDHRGLPLESIWYGEGGFEELRSRDVARFGFEVDVLLSKGTVLKTEELVQQKRQGLERGQQARPRRVVEDKLRYRLTLELVPSTGVLRVFDEELVALGREMQPKKRRPFIEKKDGNLVLRQEGRAGRPSQFPIGLDHTIASTSLYEPHYPHVAAFQRELDGWQAYYLEPRHLMRESVPVADVLAMGPRGESFAAFLNALKHREPAAFGNLAKTAAAMLPSRPQVDVMLSKEGTVGLRVTEGQLGFSGRLISEGTLRVLGLLAAVRPENAATLVAYEEPENGVHPVRIRSIADILRNAAQTHGKQVVATTHSRLFAECFQADSLYVCSRSDAGSDIKPLRSAGPLLDGHDIEQALGDAMVRGDYGG